MFNPTHYTFRSHPTFRSKYNGLQSADKSTVDNGLEDIDKQPIKCSKPMQATLLGTRGYDIAQYRVIFAACPTCIDDGHVSENDCFDCKSHHGQSRQKKKDIVKLFDLLDISPVAHIT